MKYWMRFLEGILKKRTSSQGEELMDENLDKIVFQKQQLGLPIKMHLGCGTLYKEGWINIDNNSENNIEKLDFNWDLSKDLPLVGSGVDFVYHEHFIEHLTYGQGQSFLKNILRLLKKGGVMRIACPDLDSIVEGYVKDNWRQQDWVTTYNCQWIKSRGEMINTCLNMQPWSHAYVYNKEDLVGALVEAGFSLENIYEVKFSESNYEDLKNLETRKDSLILEVEK